MDMTVLVIVMIFFGILLCLGLPVAFTMYGLAVVGTVYVWGWAGLYGVVNSALGASTKFIYIAIPLFLLMANFLQHSGLADDMYEIIYRWTGRLRGGLAIGTVIICAVFGAMAGISSVAVVTMGLVALPSMMKRGYNQSLVLGSIMAGGGLGILIPPSIIMVIYGAVAEVSIGKLFIGGIIPGIILTVLYIVYIAILCWVKPTYGPPVDVTFSLKEKLVILKGIILPILLVFLVLGTIYTGVCTPTEAAGVGAFGAFVCLLIYRRATFETLKKAGISTIVTNAMIIWIIIGAACFSNFIAVTGLQNSLNDFVFSLKVGRWWIVISMQIIFLILGMFLSPTAIITLVGPLFIPIIVELGFDPLWFGILFVVNMEMGYLTPPFGLNLFTLKGVTPPNITMLDLYRSISPFLALQAVLLALIMAVPQLTTWLPSFMN